MLHLLSVAVWVGGMFFAYLCLRPVAASQLDAPTRLRLWVGVFARFFPWVWLAVALILGSGLSMLLAVGMHDAPLHWHLMLGSGLVMMIIFFWVYSGPFPALRRAVDAQEWPAAGAQLAKIRRLVGFNVHLGLLTIAIATAGRLI
jgi:uncharacterized membrane protein